MFSAFDTKKAKSKIFSNRMFLLAGLSLYIIIMGGAQSALVTFTICIVMVYFVRSNYLKKLFMPHILIMATLVWFISIVFLDLQYHFETIIVRTLNRNLSFTGRVNTWDDAIKDFWAHPIFGSGIHQYVYLESGVILTLHSYFLDLLVQGGIFIYFLIAILLRDYAKCVNPYIGTNAGWVINIAMFSLMILFCTDPGGKGTFFIPLALAQHMPKLLSNEREVSSLVQTP
jgi:O-antigen ligase